MLRTRSQYGLSYELAKVTEVAVKTSGVYNAERDGLAVEKVDSELGGWKVEMTSRCKGRLESMNAVALATILGWRAHERRTLEVV